VLAKSTGAIATLDNSGTIVVQGVGIAGGATTDAPLSNIALSLKNAILILTAGTNPSETHAPIIGDSMTRIVYKSAGTTWNSIHPGVNLQGSTLVFEAGGDGHLSKHPSAVVSNINLRWTSTSPTDFVLGMHQNWGIDNKPSTISGLRFVSVLGNYLVSLFTFTGGSTPANLANNAFDVRPDYCYDVAPVGQRPTGIRRSFRRSDFTATASSYWGAVSICPTYLWIDPYTTLSASGVLDSGKTYLRTVDYIATGNTSTDKCVDVVTLRFAPVVMDAVGNKLAGASVTVRNKNSVCSIANTIGSYRARLVASGITDASGKISITEPTTKDYTSNASHRTDSWVHQNRTRTQAWHKWWETGVKLITVSDSRNSTGMTAPELYASSDFEASYRCVGRVFATSTLDMSAPQSSAVALSTDDNYNSAASTAGITVSYTAGVTTVVLADGSYTLDGIWKAVIDFHAHPDRHEVESVLPFTSWTSGEMRFGSALSITGSPLAVIASGAKVKTITSAKAEAFNTAGNPTVTATLEDISGVRVTVRKLGGGTFNISARSGTTGAYTDLGYQADISGVTYTVPKGKPVEVVMWALGCVTYTRTIDTSTGGVTLDAEFVVNTSINTSLDVSSYLSNMALSLDTSGAMQFFVITFNAAITVSGIELGKALFHRLASQEVALNAGFLPGSTSTIVINADEITNPFPALRLALGASLLVTDRVYLDFYINQAAALASDSSYVLNPVRADGNQVQILRSKPALDTSIMAAAVRKELTTELGRIDVATSTRLASTAYTAPANADITSIKAKTDVLGNGPTLAQIEGSTVLAKATAVAAIPTNPVLATDTRLDKLDATVSSRLAAANYSAPAAVPTAAQNAAAVRTELATELGRMDSPISSRSTLTAQDIPQGLTAAQVWENASRTLTVAAGMTAEQEAALLATRDSALHTQTVVDTMGSIS
jgi:hypothetical protein